MSGGRSRSCRCRSSYWVGGLTIWQLYVVGFTVGVCTVFFDVAYQSYIPALVGREEVVEANAKLEISRAAANIGGPGMAGGLVALLTAPVAVLVDSVSYALSALLLLRIRKQEEAPSRTERRSLRHELVEGLRYVFGNSYQRTMVAMTAISNFFGQVVFSILLVYAVRELDLTPATIGIVLAIGNLGTLASALTAQAGSVSALGVGQTILLASCLFGPGTLLIAFAPQDIRARRSSSSRA